MYFSLSIYLHTKWNFAFCSLGHSKLDFEKAKKILVVKFIFIVYKLCY